MSTSSQPWPSHRNSLSSPWAFTVKARVPFPQGIRTRRAAIVRSGARGRQVGNAGGVRRAGLRRHVPAIVGRPRLVPAPHERPVQPAVRLPEGKHLTGQVGRPGLRPARRLAGARERRVLRADRQAHRREREGALGRHPGRGEPVPVGAAILVAARIGRPVLPVPRADPVVGEQGVQAIRDARARRRRVGPRALHDGVDVDLRLEQEERAERARVVAGGQLHVEHAELHGQRRERMPVDRERETTRVRAGRRRVGDAEAQDERDILARDRRTTGQRR